MYQRWLDTIAIAAALRPAPTMRNPAHTGQSGTRQRTGFEVADAYGHLLMEASWRRLYMDIISLNSVVKPLPWLPSVSCVTINALPHPGRLHSEALLNFATAMNRSIQNGLKMRSLKFLQWYLLLFLLNELKLTG